MYFTSIETYTSDRSPSLVRRYRSNNNNNNCSTIGSTSEGGNARDNRPTPVNAGISLNPNQSMTQNYIPWMRITNRNIGQEHVKKFFEYNAYFSINC